MIHVLAFNEKENDPIAKPNDPLELAHAHAPSRAHNALKCEGRVFNIWKRVVCGRLEGKMNMIVEESNQRRGTN